MKKQFLKFALSAIFFIAIQNLSAQNAPPPPGGHGQQGNAPASGGSAPIGGGEVIMILMAAAYGGNKIYSAISKNKFNN